MSANEPQYGAAETARRGDEIYEREVRPRLEQANEGRVVAIDVVTEAFEIGENAVEASDKLLERVKNPEIWFVRIGHPVLHRIGGHSSLKALT